MKTLARIISPFRVPPFAVTALPRVLRTHGATELTKKVWRGWRAGGFAEINRRAQGLAVWPWKETSPRQSRIMFISGEPDTAGHLYRVVRYSQSLNEAGFDSAWIRVDRVPAYLGTERYAAAIVLWRVVWSDPVAQLIAGARDAGTRIIFDVDDYMVDPDLVLSDTIDGVRSMHLVKEEAARVFERIRQTALAADFCTCTTPGLAAGLRRLSKPVFVLPNGFDAEALDTSEAASGVAGDDDGIVRIGYASGSRTHQRDFAVVAPAIARILGERPECRLVLFKNRLAPVDRQETLDPREFPVLAAVAGQIEWRTLVPLERLPAELARFDINLAPLETGNIFCEAKSELKYFEAALVGVPTVASPTQPFRAAISHGVTGFLAETTADWYRCLGMLLDDPALRRRMGRDALHGALWPFGPERRAERAAVVYRQILTGGQAAAASFQADLHHARSPASALPVVPDFSVIFQSQRHGLSDVTVVVPLHDYSEVIVEALDSVKNQSLQDIDLVIVEDRSADDSLSVARAWLDQNHDRFGRAALLQNTRNAGLGQTRNAGFWFARTRFVLPLDADNILLPDCLQRCLQVLTDTGTTVAYPTMREFEGSDGLRGTEDWKPALFAAGNYVDAMALVRKAAWAAVGGYQSMTVPGWEDYDFWCRFVEHGFWGVRVPDVLAHYRVHRTSMLHTQTDLPDKKALLRSEMHQRHPWLGLESSE